MCTTDDAYCYRTLLGPPGASASPRNNHYPPGGASWLGRAPFLPLVLANVCSYTGAVGERAPYAELHCHSNFSFLDGASHPEELVEEAADLRLDALAVTDHDGMYGVVRFAEAAGAAGLPTVFGAELSLGPLPAPERHRRP